MILRILVPLLASTVMVAVSADAAAPVDFDTEIIPILTRHGCNAGSCHGAAVGRGGFKLSLLGSDAAADFEAITFQLEGRRVNLHDVDLSLVLRKPSEQTGHEGGLVLPDDSPTFATLRRWIAEGTQRIGRRSLVDLWLTPAELELAAPGDGASVSVTASFDDGTVEDVTDQTVLAADDPDSIAVDLAARRLTAKRRGVHTVIARYLDRVMPLRIVVPLHTPPSVPLARQSDGQIDDLINAQLDRLNLPSSPPADDASFLRRLSLDLIGQLPTAEEVRRFLEDHDADKRARKIDELLQRDQFADYWALKWAGVLSIDSKQLGPEGAAAYHGWITRRLADDAPVDETAKILLTAVGDSFVDGAANFSRTGSSPGELAEYATRVFMGVRLRCANCHNHPLDIWQQDDYHGLAAIFAKLRRGRVVTVSDRGEVTHPATGLPARPKIPGQPYLDPELDGRAEFARWLTSNQAPYLSRITVNRLWQQLMGRGLVEPVDDIRLTNPATHPELLEWLASDFAEHGYHLKHTIALICNSAAYQRDSTAGAENESDETFYSHTLTRPLEAEVIADAIGDVTGIPLPTGSAGRAVQLTDNRFASPSLDVLGRCDRSETCTSAASSASLAQSLHLINGSLINDRLTDPDGNLQQLLSRQADDQLVIEELYLRTLARLPSAGEQAYWKAELESLVAGNRSTRTEFYEDLLWGLLTSRAFLTNH